MTVASLKTPRLTVFLCDFTPRPTQTESCVKPTCLFEHRCNSNRVQHGLRRSKKTSSRKHEAPRGGVGKLLRKPRHHFCGHTALLEWTAPAMCFHLPGLEDANRNAPTAVMTRALCGHTAGGASVVKLMQYPSTLHRQLRTSQHISGKVGADDPLPPPRWFKIRRAWLQVTPVFSSEGVKAQRARSAF